MKLSRQRCLYTQEGRTVGERRQEGVGEGGGGEEECVGVGVGPPLTALRGLGSREGPVRLRRHRDRLPKAGPRAGPP